MKKHGSVLALYVRSVWKAAAVIIALTCAAQAVLFYRALYEMKAVLTDTGVLDWSYEYGLEQVFEKSHILWPALIGLALLGIVLCRNGCERGGKQSYTLQRLQISEKSIFWWQAVCDCAYFFLFWMMEVLVVFLCSHWYCAVMPEAVVTEQTIFLAFYRNLFLHNLLPLSEIARWVRNFFLLLTLGITAAFYPYRQRRGKNGSGVIWTFFWLAWQFMGEIGHANSVIVSLLCIFICAVCTAQVYLEEDV